MTRRSASPDETFAIGEDIGSRLEGGEMILLEGGLGAGKTLLTKGIMSALGFDVDEVTSPSFTLVNRYPTDRFDVYHIDLWRLDSGEDLAFAVGLHEILEDHRAVVVIEWADRLDLIGLDREIVNVMIDGDGDEPRTISISEHLPVSARDLAT